MLPFYVFLLILLFCFQSSTQFWVPLHKLRNPLDQLYSNRMPYSDYLIQPKTRDALKVECNRSLVVRSNWGFWCNRANRRIAVAFYMSCAPRVIFSWFLQSLCPFIFYFWIPCLNTKGAYLSSCISSSKWWPRYRLFLSTQFCCGCLYLKTYVIHQSDSSLCRGNVSQFIYSYTFCTFQNLLSAKYGSCFTNPSPSFQALCLYKCIPHYVILRFGLSFAYLKSRPSWVSILTHITSSTVPSWGPVIPWPSNCISFQNRTKKI